MMAIKMYDVKSGQLVVEQNMESAIRYKDITFVNDDNMLILIPDVSYDKVGAPLAALDVHYLSMSSIDLVAEACGRRLRTSSKFTRYEMQLLGYPDESPEIDVCKDL
jgi:hypothetical protein